MLLIPGILPFWLAGMFLVALLTVGAAILLMMFACSVWDHLKERKETREALKQVIWTEDGKDGDYTKSPIGFVKVQNTEDETVTPSGQDNLAKLENIFGSDPAEKK